MSRRTCLALGTKLPDSHSCGDPCSEFPFCLPPLPASTAPTLAALLTKSQIERQRARFLNDLRNTIADVEGEQWKSSS
jgi:hypothetical protein